MGITALRRYWRERMAALEEASRVATGAMPRLEAVVATPLPEDFPARGKLEAAGIYSLEDVRAQSVSALQKLGLSKREAQAAIEAAEAEDRG